jgi:NADH-quinone oxidoreductase subunit K
MIPLSWYLVLAAGLFSVGLYGVFSRKNTVGILMGIELMLNAANINIVSFWRYIAPENIAGQVFALMVLAVSAAEVAVGIALVLAIYRRRKTVSADEIDLMKW